jgi:hypothetical protein
MAKNQSEAWLWPAVDTPEQAVRAARRGMWAAVLVAGVTALAAGLALSGGEPVAGVDGSAFVDAVLFGVIGWGIRRLSRVAAVAGLVLYLLERAYMWAEGGDTNIAFAIILSFCFVTGIRGTFAHHRLATDAAAALPHGLPRPIQPR